MVDIDGEILLRINKLNNKTMEDYTEQQVIDYAINTLVIQKTRKRYYLDNRNYLIHVLYHKFRWTERRLQDLFLTERSGINHSKQLVMNLIKTKDSYFVEHTQHLYELFPINFETRRVMDKNILWEKRTI